MKREVLQKIETATSPDFGGLLSKSIDLFKRVWVESLVHLLIAMIVVVPIMLLFYIPFIPVLISSIQGEYSNGVEPFLNYPIIGIVGYFLLFIILMVVMQAVMFAITAHFFKVCKNEDLGLKKETGGYFSYLKGSNFSKVFLLSLATFGISIAAILLCYLPIIYVMVPLQLMVVLFAFNDTLSVSDIILLSFKLGTKFWLLLFGLIIVSSIIAQLGVFLCFVGIFFTANFIYIPIYYFYKETIGFNDDTESFNTDFSAQ